MNVGRVDATKKRHNSNTSVVNFVCVGIQFTMSRDTRKLMPALAIGDIVSISHSIQSPPVKAKFLGPGTENDTIVYCFETIATPANTTNPQGIILTKHALIHRVSVLQQHKSKIVLDGKRCTFKTLEAKGDGNCLYRCFARYVTTRQEDFPTFKFQCIQHIDSHWSYFSQFFPDDMDKDTLLSKKQRANTWGDSEDILAFSELYNCRVHVYETISNSSPVLTETFPAFSDMIDAPLLRLLRSDGRHYDMIQTERDTFYDKAKAFIKNQTTILQFRQLLQ